MSQELRKELDEQDEYIANLHSRVARMTTQRDQYRDECHSLKAQLDAIRAACDAACPDNLPEVVGTDAVDHELGRWVAQNDDGDVIINATTPGELVAQLMARWNECAEALAKLRRLVQ